jgi:hypothetical protein
MSESATETVPVGGALSGVEKLSSTHVAKTFKSGRHSLDLFIKRHALKNQQADSSQTYVVHRNETVIGYYSLTVASVDRQDCPPAITDEMPPGYRGYVKLEPSRAATRPREVLRPWANERRLRQQSIRIEQLLETESSSNF